MTIPLTTIVTVAQACSTVTTRMLEDRNILSQEYVYRASTN